MKTCSVEGCPQPYRARGFCSTHYSRWYKETYPERVAALVEKGRASRKEYARAYYLKNRGQVLERQRRYREADPEGYRKKTTENARRWALANPERARENRRRSWAKRKYGLTLEEYEAIIARGCAVCGSHEGRATGGRGQLPGKPPPRLVIDHDHANGKVRDALCHNCNTAIGQMADDPQRLRAAADYIERHR